MKTLNIICMICLVTLIAGEARGQHLEPFSISGPPIPEGALFGYSVMDLGDLDGNGASDLAVGAPGEHPMPHYRVSQPSQLLDFIGYFDDRTLGNIRVLMMADDQQVEGIEELKLPFARTTNDVINNYGDSLGLDIYGLGDINADGTNELILGKSSNGWLPEVMKTSFMNDGALEFPVEIGAYRALEFMGDLDANGVNDLLTITTDRGGTYADVGRIVAELVSSGGSRAQKTVANWKDYSTYYRFGTHLKKIADLDNDGIPEFVVSDQNAVWVFSLNSSLTVDWAKKIEGSQLGVLEGGRFGQSFDRLGDTLDSDHLIVTAPGSHERAGSLHVLRLSEQGEVLEHRAITESELSVQTSVNLDNHVSVSVEEYDPVSSGFVVNLGTPYADVINKNSGAVHKLRIEPGTPPHMLMTVSNQTLIQQDFGTGLGRFTQVMGDWDDNGVPDLLIGNTVWMFDEKGKIIYSQVLNVSSDFNILPVGDLNGDGSLDVAMNDALAQSANLIQLNPDGTIKYTIRLDNNAGGPLYQTYGSEDVFGLHTIQLGDVNGDNVSDLAISSFKNDAAQNLNEGSAIILFMNEDGTPKASNKITIQGPNRLTSGGVVLSGPGDINGDSIPDLAVGFPGAGSKSDIDPGSGAVYVLLLNSDGTLSSQTILSAESGLADVFAAESGMGFVSAMGDLDADGVPDLLVGPTPEGTTVVKGVRILFLNTDGTLRTSRLLDQSHGPYQKLMSSALAAGSLPQRMWDIDGDGTDEILFDYLESFSGKWSPMVVSLGPLLGAEIDKNSSQKNMADEGEDFSVGAEIRSLGNREITNVDVNFRPAGSKAFLSLPLVHSEGVHWSEVIPGFLMTSTGLEYFFTAATQGTAERREPENGFFSVQVASDKNNSIELPAGTEESGYRLLSSPLNLVDPDLQPVLAASFGESDASSWRFFTAERTPRNAPETSIMLSPGQAYWAISRERRLIDWGSGRSVRTDSIFALQIPPGWSAFGSPFNFNIGYDQLALESGADVDIRRYHGAWEVHDSTLVPFEGYFILNGTGGPDNLYFSPSKELAENSAFFDSGVSKTSLEFEWSMPIHARMGRARDIDNLAVVGSSFSNRADPPPIGDYVRLAFEGGDYPLSTSALRAESGLKEWAFSVTSRLPGSVRVQFPDLSEVPDGYAVTLVDPATGIRQDLRKTPSYTVASGGEGSERTLRLEVDANGFTDEVLPTELALKPAFPNPFSGSTTLSYALPEASFVELEVFYILGRRIATLEQAERSAGNHVAVWDGRANRGDISPGLYLARLRTAHGTQSVTITKTR